MGRRIHLVASLAVFVGVVGLAAVAGVRVAATPDLMTVAWWSDGVLHVGSHTIRTHRPENLEMVHNGVVVWAPPEVHPGPYDIVWVDDPGDRRVIGSKTWPSPLAADPTGSTVSWVDQATRATQPRLVIYDTDERAVVAERSLMRRGPRWGLLDAGSFPISIDDDRVYYAAQDGEYRWDFRRNDPPRRLKTPTYLHARRAGVSITTLPYGDNPRITAGGLSAPFPDGSTRQISPDGQLAGGSGIDGGIALWDVAAQRRLAPGPLEQRPVADVSFDQEGRVVVVRGTKVDPEEDFGMGLHFRHYGPPFDIAVCSVKPVACTTIPGSKSKTRPVLAK